MNKIYVIGAGLAGLSVYKFSNYQNIIQFFEKNSCYGGRIKSIKSGYSIFEIGSQFFCKSDENIWKIIEKENLRDDILKLDFSNMSFYYKDKLTDNLNDVVEVIENVLESKNGEGKNNYFDEWFIKKFGEEKLFIPKGVLRAITFGDSSNTLTEYGIYILETFFEDCFTFNDGLGKIINALSKNANIMKSTVQELIFDNNKLIKIVTNNETIDTTNDIIVLTAPAGDIQIKNHEELSDALNKIKYNGCGVVIFKVDKSFSEKSDFIFFPEEKYKISVIEQIRIDSDEFVGCLIPYTFSIDKDKTISHTIEFLGKYFDCNFEKKIIETWYEAWDKGLPSVDKNFIAAIEKLKKMQFDNLLFAGDYTDRFPSMDSAVKSGIEVAEKIQKLLS